MIDSCPVNVRNIDKELITECRIVAKSQDVPFVLMTIPYVSNRGFFDALTDKSLGRKQIVATLARTYSYLLSALKYLLAIEVVQFDLKGENILYNLVTKDPQIIDFGISLPMDRVKPDTWNKYFYAYAPEYYVWPLEVHLINFLLHVSSPLEKADVHKITDAYTRRNKALDVFSEDFREKYRELCEVCLQPYIDKAKEEVIPDLIKQYESWDNYGLSVLYLKALSYMFPNGAHRNKILVQFTQLLLLNISPDYSTRISLDKTRKRFEKIFFADGNPEDYDDLVYSFEYDSALTTRRIGEDIARLRSSKPKSS